MSEGTVSGTANTQAQGTINTQTISTLPKLSYEVISEPLKKFAKKELRDCPITREIILEEPDRIPVEEFVTKSLIWLRLLEKEIRR